jgi:hypothetical protein
VNLTNQILTDEQFKDLLIVEIFKCVVPNVAGGGSFLDIMETAKFVYEKLKEKE